MNTSNNNGNRYFQHRTPLNAQYTIGNQQQMQEDFK